tara:strand:- start:850 stop:1077 length:228 start_codon:yes stop_codon:yes gene_type:complete
MTEESQPYEIMTFYAAIVTGRALAKGLVDSAVDETYRGPSLDLYCLGVATMAYSAGIIESDPRGLGAWLKSQCTT